MSYRPRRRRSPSPLPFIMSGVALLLLLAGLLLWATKQETLREDDPAVAVDPALSAGPRPRVSLSGAVPIVQEYLADNLNDPDVEYVGWGPPILDTDPRTGRQTWHVLVRFRARNAFNALILDEWLFEIRHGEVVNTIRARDIPQEELP